MKIGILTFQFAHNYGALLQAFSLRKYLCSYNTEPDILNFVPQKLKNEYSINPFAYSKRPLTCLSLFLRNVKRLIQYRLFKSFQADFLLLKRPIYTGAEFSDALKKYDAVIVGSDQVWNTDITGNIPNYFLSDIDYDGKMMSYAASFGKQSLNSYETEKLKCALPRFSAISVRESRGVDLVKACTGIKSELVCDPVFLTGDKEWISVSRKPKSVKKEKFLVYYSLKENNELRMKAESYAKAHGLIIYSVHPTGVRQKISGIQLYDIGPMEFIWLIKNAEVVFSNSFHATAFSAIFRKRLVYIPVKGLESRVDSLIEALDVKKTNGVYDFSAVDSGRLKQYAESGKKYLNKMIAGML